MKRLVSTGKYEADGNLWFTSCHPTSPGWDYGRRLVIFTLVKAEGESLQKETATAPRGNSDRFVSRFGSPGRTRTCDQPVTRPPIFRLGLDYLFTRLNVRGGCRALLRPYWVGSSASSLCTFLPTAVPFGRLRSGFPFRTRGDGFPEFT